MSWEFNVLYWFQSIHNNILDKFFASITKLGDGGIFWIIVILLLLIFVKDKRLGWTGVLALALDFLICNVILKNVIQRERPFAVDPTLEPLVTKLINLPKDFSFPSGHSAFSFAAAVSIVQYKKKWGIAAIVLASLIAISRLYLGVHFPTDVIGGCLVGICMGLLAGLIVKKISEVKAKKKIAKVE